MKFFARKEEPDTAGDADRLPDVGGTNAWEPSQRHRDSGCGGRWRRAIVRDYSLSIAVILLILLMNIRIGRYILYPFVLFSTWVHEMCHGLAALFLGGNIEKLLILKDGSGLAYTTSIYSDRQRGFVASGGYPGTAITGCLLLLFRRTLYGPRVGTIGLGLAQILSCMLYIRNPFGVIVILIEGVILLLAGWFLPNFWRDNFYTFLALTICLNAFTSIRYLFSLDEAIVINGLTLKSDAHTVAGVWGGNYRHWALVWLLVSLIFTALGYKFAPDTRGEGTSSTAAPATDATPSTPDTTADDNEILSAVHGYNSSATTVSSPSVDSGPPQTPPPFAAHTV